jgi:filamentous hemagglutinin family protein
MASSPHYKPTAQLNTPWIVSVVLWTTLSLVAVEQIHAMDPITPSGLTTQVTLSSSPPPDTVQYDITGGTRAGTNLFHSFGDFNVPRHTIANFLNEAGVPTTNILGRVTGGQASTILGTIQTTGFDQANLFLMNPAGMVFGPTASLNVGGAVTFTTADYLRLSHIDGKAGIFHATPTLSSVLTSTPVAAFGFLGASPASIMVQGATLSTQPGQTLSFVGGNLTVESGTLTTVKNQPSQHQASAGQIHLASVTSPGEVLSNTLDLVPNINGQAPDRLGTITLADRSVVDTSGAGGGTVRIRSGHFVLDDSKIVAHITGPGRVSNGVETTGAGISIVSSQDVAIQHGAAVEVTVANGTTPDTTYGGVRVTADRIIFQGLPGSALNFDSLPFTGIVTSTKGAGNAGSIVLRATRDINLNNVVQLSSFSGFAARGLELTTSPAQGHAGNIDLISLHGDILMTHGGRATLVSSQLGNSTGDTGSVMATAAEGTIALNGTSLVTRSASGEGHIGPVAITAHNLQMRAGLLSNENRGPSKPGGITLTLSDSLTMETDATVPAPIPSHSLIVTSAFSPTTSAPAGDITIAAKHLTAAQRTLVSTETFSSGPGGQLRISADTLQLTNGSQIKSGSTFAPEPLPQGTLPTGPGGAIQIQAIGPTGSLQIDGEGSGIFSNTQGMGTGGTINLSAKTLTMQNGGILSAETSGTSADAIGGSIIVHTTDQVMLNSGGSITASSTVHPTVQNSGIANAGNIAVNAGRQLELQDHASIRTTTQSDQANGGNIEIRAIDRVRLVNQSEISTSVKGAEGSGGNIFIDPQMVIVQGSAVTAQAVGGAGGNITFVTPLFLADSASVVSASSQQGPSGTVTIQSPTSNISGTVGQLAAKPSPPQVLLQNHCVAKSGNGQSTFLLTGRNSLPDEPDGWLSTPISVNHWTGEEDSAHASGLMVQKHSPNRLPTIAKQSPDPAVLSLRHLTPPGFLVRSFGTASTDCRS